MGIDATFNIVQILLHCFDGKRKNAIKSVSVIKLTNLCGVWWLKNCRDVTIQSGFDLLNIEIFVFQFHHAWNDILRHVVLFYDVNSLQHEIKPN